MLDAADLGTSLGRSITIDGTQTSGGRLAWHGCRRAADAIARGWSPGGQPV